MDHLRIPPVISEQNDSPMVDIMPKSSHAMGDWRKKALQTNECAASRCSVSNVNVNLELPKGCNACRSGAPYSTRRNKGCAGEHPFDSMPGRLTIRFERSEAGCTTEQPRLGRDRLVPRLSSRVWYSKPEILNISWNCCAKR